MTSSYLDRPLRSLGEVRRARRRAWLRGVARDVLGGVSWYLAVCAALLILGSLRW